MGWRELFGFRRAAPAATEKAVQVVRARAPQLGSRQFLAGVTDRLTSDLAAYSSPVPINQLLRQQLTVMRARSRFLCRNNDHAKAFLRLVRRNIVGPHGIGLQMQVPTLRGDKQDKNANARIEDGYARWSRKGVCTVDGMLSRQELERLVISQVATDGEVFVRLVKSRANRWRFAVELFDADCVPETLNVPRGTGFLDAGYQLPPAHEIVMGVERDAGRRPVAYWFRAGGIGDFVGVGSQKFQRVPADEVLHIFTVEAVGQARGIPWLFCGMRRLAMLGGYEEAELVAARTAASKMGFFTENENGEAPPIDGVDSTGAPVTEAQPGVFSVLPQGMSFTPFDPQHPTEAFPDFVKAMLRSVSAGAGVSYAALTGDLEQANYSSLRQGALEEREEWRVMQGWFIDSFARPIFEGWLQQALGFGALAGLDPTQEERWNSPVFVPRGWSWVDPAKEIEADERAVKLGVKTRRQICAERGLDFEEIVEQLAAEQKLAAAAGIDISGSQPAQPAEPASDPKEDSNEDA